MTKIKAIIFDLWETLGTKNIGISKTFQKQFGISPTSDYLVKYENAIQLKKWDRENYAAQSLLAAFGIPRKPENISFVVDLFRQGIAHATLFPGMKDLLIALSVKYKLGILSNTTNFESQILVNWGINDLFSAQVFSWQVNSLKPSARNFQVICTKLNFEPEECLFIDNGQVNIDAAIENGLNGKIFEGLVELKTYLRRVGILSA